jgi:CHAT domain-containing protein
VLVIADPTHALPHARSEGEYVAHTLAPGGTVTLLSGAQATRDAVLAALPGSQLVHFAGHGRLGSSGPLDQRLELAESGALAISDVLALTEGPQNVVLSACDAGSSPERSAVPRALGMAQAFVTRGARAVVAPVRPVEDGASRELVERLYAHYRASHDLVLALRDAQVEISRQTDKDTWKSFRAWVR